MAKHRGSPGAGSRFALGCAYALLIVIVLLVLAFLFVWWRLGFIGNLAN